MAIDPPWRLDPFRNIVNVHWQPELPTDEFDGRFIATTIGHVFGDYDSYGASNNGDYYVYGSLEAPPYGWKFDDGFIVKQWGPRFLIHNSGSINAEAKVSNNSGGLFLGGSWYDDAGQNPPYGSWGIDLSGVSASKIELGEMVVMRVRYLDNFTVGTNPYAAWVSCFVHWSS